MKKFVVLYTAPVSAEKQMESNADDMKEVMEQWGVWYKKNKSNVTDFGTPLGNSMKVTKEGGTKNQTWTVGYSIMQADSMDEVVEALKDHPHLNMPGGCEIQVYESLPVPGMG